MRIENVIQTVQRKLVEASTQLHPWFEEDPELIHYQPKDGGWSGVRILEHVVTTSHYLLLLIEKGSVKAMKRAQITPLNIDWDDYVLVPKALEDIGIHKSFPWMRQDHMEPKGKMSMPDIRKRFDKQIMDCFNYLNCLKNGEGILCTTTMSVNGIGKLDVYQYIYFLALHAIRHVDQLEENKGEFLEIVNCNHKH